MNFTKIWGASLLVAAITSQLAEAHSVYRAYRIPEPPGYNGCVPLAMNIQRTVLFSCTTPGGYSEAVLSTKNFNAPILPPDWASFYPIGIDNNNIVYGNIDEIFSAEVQPVTWKIVDGKGKFKPVPGGAAIKAVSTNGNILFQPSTSSICPTDSRYGIIETTMKVQGSILALSHSSPCTYVLANRINNQGVVAGNDGTSYSRDISYTAVSASASSVSHPQLLTGLSNALDINDSGNMVGITSRWPDIGSFGWYYDQNKGSLQQWNYFAPTRISKSGIGYGSYDVQLYFGISEEYVVDVADIIVGPFDPALVIRGVVDISDRGEMLIRASNSTTLRYETLILLPVPSTH